MSEKIQVPGLVPVNQANIDAILAANEARIKEMQDKRTAIGSTAGAVTGAAIVGAFSLGIGIPAGAAIGGAIGGALGKLSMIFNKKQPWSALGGDDKVNLIMGLIYEAVWQKELLNVQAVKSHILTVMVDKGIIFKKDEEVNKFFPNNAWALSRIEDEVLKANNLINLIQRIENSLLTEINLYNNRKNLALAYQTLDKIKAGKAITKKEAELFIEAQALLKAVNAAKNKRNQSVQDKQTPVILPKIQVTGVVTKF